MKRRRQLSRSAWRALSLLELLVVMLILGVIAVMAIGVFLKHVTRTKYAAARSDIRSLETAINLYHLSLDEFPPSSSWDGTQFISPYFGCGMLLVLELSSNANPTNPSDPRWQGPYIKFHETKQGFVPVSFTNESAMYLDPWGNPYFYCRGGNLNPVTHVPQDYLTFGGTEYPPANIKANFETYFNPLTFQLFSMGPNELTLTSPSQGLDIDDVTNFEGIELTPFGTPLAAPPAPLTRGPRTSGMRKMQLQDYLE